MQGTVAIFVDGDNVAAAHAATILARARTLGRVDLARAYLNPLGSATAWCGTPGFRAVCAASGRNAADLLLTVEAMEAGLTGGFDAVVLASSDADLAPLATRLRERHLTVLGLGEAKAPEALRAACSRFEELRPPPPVEATAPLDRRIAEMIAAHDTDGAGMRIVELAPKMHAAHGTRISTSRERTWRAYLSARPALFELDPRGPEARVRSRASAPGAA